MYIFFANNVLFSLTFYIYIQTFSHNKHLFLLTVIFLNTIFRMRNFNSSIWSACSLNIATRHELPFLTKRSWRDSEADALGFNKQFIRNLGEKTRIHLHYFSDIDVKNNKPIGMCFSTYLYFVIFIRFFQVYRRTTSFT